MFNPGLGQYHRHVNINQQYVRYSKHIRYPDFQPRSSVPRIVVILCFAPADVFKFVPFLSQLFLIVQLVVTTKLLQNQTSIVAKVDPPTSGRTSWCSTRRSTRTLRPDTKQGATVTTMETMPTVMMMLMLLMMIVKMVLIPQRSI